jgi:CDP-paratose 2-epimerase
MSIDSSTHSLFGVSKAAGDLLVQEYGRYFDIRCNADGAQRLGVSRGDYAGRDLHRPADGFPPADLRPEPRPG